MGPIDVDEAVWREVPATMKTENLTGEKNKVMTHDGIAQCGCSQPYLTIPDTGRIMIDIQAPAFQKRTCCM